MNLRKLSALMAIVIGLMAIAPRSHAGILIGALEPEGWAEGNYGGGPVSALGSFMRWTACIVLLPFCLLDENAKIDGAVTVTDLVDDGYSLAQAEDFAAENKQLASNIVKRRMRLVVSKADTRSSLQSDILGVMPNASNEFVDFYVSQILP
jgi:hypothetical protein